MVGFLGMKRVIRYITSASTLGLAFLSAVALSLVVSKSQNEPLLQVNSSRAPVFEKARRSYDFVNSVGVNTHLNYFDCLYGNFPLVERELESVGIRHLRDGVHLQNPDYNRSVYGRWIELGKSGARFDAVVDPRSSLPPLTPPLLAEVDALAGQTIESFEGPNELDISKMDNWAVVDRSFQEQLFKSAREMPGVRPITVIGPSLAFVRNGSSVGDLSDRVDEINLHPYPAGKMPSIVFPEQTDVAKMMSSSKPIVFTETGYHNAVNDHHDQPAVSEAAAAKYVPRLFLEDFVRGIQRTYLYEFMDEKADPELGDNQQHWGLIRADGSEKPAFTALKNLIAELQDLNTPAPAQQLSWSINSSNSSVHHLLLQKANGNLDLVLWQEVPSYDYRKQVDVRNTSESAVLTLGQKARNVTLFEPSVQAKPLQSYTEVVKVPLEIPDSPLVVEIALR
jgi:hypothetical protein